MTPTGALIETPCMWTGLVVIVAGSIILSIGAIRLVAETFLWSEDRVCRILKVQKPMFNYLIHHELYERLMDQHKRKQKEVAE